LKKRANIKVKISVQISAFVICISIMTNGAVIINFWLTKVRKYFGSNGKGRTEFYLKK
jgi:hypothetical protein